MDDPNLESLNLSDSKLPPLPPLLPPRIISSQLLPNTGEDEEDDARRNNSVSPLPPLNSRPQPVSQLHSRLDELRNTISTFDSDNTADNLKNFHSHAMDLMESVAVAAPNASSVSSTPSPGIHTAIRIRRDKKRLEEHYHSTMSFLNKADAGDASVLIEEEELEADEPNVASAVVDRFQLQCYAREAMSFLEKAFSQDETVLIDDGSVSAESIENHNPTADAASIQHDKAELARYDEKFGQFLDKALDDGTIVVSEDGSNSSEYHDAFEEVSPESPMLPPKSPQGADAPRSLDGVDGLSDDTGMGGVKFTVVEEEEDENSSVVEAKSYNHSSENYDGNDKRKSASNFRPLPSSSKEVRNGNSFDKFNRARKGPTFVERSKINILASGSQGSEKELDVVNLERTFFRKLPRGATIRIMPTAPAHKTGVPHENKAECDCNARNELEEVQNERNALIEIVEEIVNERSMLAFQLGEMKHVMNRSKGKGEALISDTDEDIDIVKELQNAYETMRSVTEETEDTINFLEDRHRKAEEENVKQKTILADLEEKYLNVCAESTEHELIANELEEKHRAASEENAKLKKFIAEKENELIEFKSDPLKMAGKEELYRMQTSSFHSEVSYGAEKASSANLSSELEIERSNTKELELVVGSQKERITELESSLEEAKSKHVELNTKQKAENERDSKTAEELKNKLLKLQREANAREELMRRQMLDLKEHADRAVAAAALAEQNADQAASTASSAQSHAKTQIEVERSSRVALEAKLEEKISELDAKEEERKAWEKYAREKAQERKESDLLSKGSSRRAVSNLAGTNAKNQRRTATDLEPQRVGAQGSANSSNTGRTRRMNRLPANEDERYTGRRKPHKRLFG